MRRGGLRRLRGSRSLRRDRGGAAAGRPTTAPRGRRRGAAVPGPIVISLAAERITTRRDDAGRTAVDAVVVAGHGALAGVAATRAERIQGVGEATAAAAGRGGLGDHRCVLCGGGMGVRRRGGYR